MTTTAAPAWAPVFPLDTTVNAAGHLEIGGCDAVELAERFGTPVYVYDEQTLREQCRAFVREFRARQPEAQVVYASKAGIFRALAKLVAEEGLGFDVVSGGELEILLAAGVNPSTLVFHGNNKSEAELRLAVERGVGRIVVDNFHELALLNDIANDGEKVPVSLRVSPSIDPHTHAKTTTGILDSKFGFPIETGAAADAVELAMAAPNLDLRGIHVHLGSPIFELEPYELASDVVIAFARQLEDRFGFELKEYTAGGGMAISYLEDALAPPIADYAERVVSSLHAACEKHGFPVPTLTIEPGRSIVGRAGVALYTAGARKAIPGVRTYVSVDGGMADNIRPAIYGSQYTALLANKPAEAATETVTIAGKYCESGDILIKDIALPSIDPGDIVAVPASGAYCVAMSSNYNAAYRPPIVFVSGGQARLVRRRETVDDLMRADVDA